MPETRKEIAATTDGNEPPRDSNIFLYLLQRMDSMESNLRNEIKATNERIDAVHQELHSSTRWIIGTIITGLGVAVAIAGWLIG